MITSVSISNWNEVWLGAALPAHRQQQREQRFAQKYPALGVQPAGTPLSAQDDPYHRFRICLSANDKMWVIVNLEKKAKHIRSPGSRRNLLRIAAAFNSPWLA